MAEGSAPEERTELPTGKRWNELRKEGAIHLSTELAQVAALFSAFYALQYFWALWYHKMQLVMKGAFALIARHEPFTTKELHQGFLGLLLMFGPSVGIFVVVIAFVASLAVLLQTKFNIKEKKIKFDWNFFNPIGGIKRIVSIQGLINTGKALFKLLLMFPIGVLALKGFAPQMLQLMFLSLDDLFAFTGSAMRSIFWKLFYVYIAFALFDYFYGRYQWFRVNKMTKDEVKDERKAEEGDETTRKKIMGKAFERAAKRVAYLVPKADVVVTNPTHFAVALKYDKATMKAPIVLCKGQDFLALRIREIAQEAGVPVLERKALARALYASAKEGSEIPYELFRAVAEVLAYVYRLKSPFSSQAGKQ